MFDLIGIGIGPFNLSLAALLDQKNLKAKFFEQKPQFSWHSGMLLPDTTLQVPFLADLVSMVDPMNKFSFLNYLKEHNRLYQFYFFEEFQIPRIEYDHYCSWASKQIDSLQFNSEVIKISISEGCYAVEVRHGSKLETYRAKNLVLGTGSVPTLPACLQVFAEEYPDKVMHTANYGHAFSADNKSKIVVLGSGQSSAEVFQSLLNQQTDQYGNNKFHLDWITRTQGFLPMEYSKLGLEHFTPAYTEYFYNLPQSIKDKAVPKQGLFYKGISFSTISSIYDQLYHRTIGGKSIPVSLTGLCELQSVERNWNGSFDLHFSHTQKKVNFSLNVDAIIAGTGYSHSIPKCLDNLTKSIIWDNKNRLQIDESYRVKHLGPGNIFIQNGELHTHGISSPDLGLGAWRAAKIANQLLPHNPYVLPSKTSFQSFGIPTNAKEITSAVEM